MDVPATDLVTLSWLPTVYVSEFLAENDPGGVPWNVAVDGQNVSGTALALFVSLPNGTFAYAASAPRAESLYPATGDAQVAGAGTMVYISFAVSPGVLRGSIVPGFAHLTVAGTPENVSDGAFELSLPPGNYTVVATLAGYQPYLRERLARRRGNRVPEHHARPGTRHPRLQFVVPPGRALGTRLELLGLDRARRRRPRGPRGDRSPPAASAPRPRSDPIATGRAGGTRRSVDPQRTRPQTARPCPELVARASGPGPTKTFGQRALPTPQDPCVKV